MEIGMTMTPTPEAAAEREALIARFERLIDVHPMLDASQSQIRRIRAGWMANEVLEACAAEREACARICEALIGTDPAADEQLLVAAKAIREGAHDT
jgi:hypothetical protein